MPVIEPSVYKVTITAPDGKTREVEFPGEQVRFFQREMADAFQTAAYLAYTELWFHGDDEVC